MAKGLAFRKLSRASDHRNHLLRNLVTSLFHHERISTTVAKAKEAQREAEKIITKAKKSLQADRRGANQQAAHASAYVFARKETVPILTQLAQRYATRPGGYTRLHLAGNRPGDHAPRALLELVDNDKGDLRFEMTARAMARETFLRAKRHSSGLASLGTHVLIDQPGDMQFESHETFNELTRINIAKCLKFAPDVAERRKELLNTAAEHLARLRAREDYSLEKMIDAMDRYDTKRNEENPDIPGQEQAKKAALAHMYYKAGVRPEQLPWPKQMLTDRQTRDPKKKTPPVDVPEAIFQPKPLAGKRHAENKTNSVIRLGKGVFAKRQQWRLNPATYLDPPSRNRKLGKAESKEPTK